MALNFPFKWFGPVCTVFVMAVTSVASADLNLGEDETGVDKALLSQLLVTCENNVRCYRNGIRSILGENVEPDQAVLNDQTWSREFFRPLSDFECKKSSSKYAVWDVAKNKYTTDEYDLSLDECRATLTQAIQNAGLICARDINDKGWQIKLMADDNLWKHNNSYYDVIVPMTMYKNVPDCMRSITERAGSILCVPNSDDQYLRFDLDNNQFLDVSPVGDYRSCKSLIHGE